MRPTNEELKWWLKVFLYANSAWIILAIISFSVFFIIEFIRAYKYKNSEEGAWVKKGFKSKN